MTRVIPRGIFEFEFKSSSISLNAVYHSINGVKLKCNGIVFNKSL